MCTSRMSAEAETAGIQFQDQSMLLKFLDQDNGTFTSPSLTLNIIDFLTNGSLELVVERGEMFFFVVITEAFAAPHLRNPL